MRENDIRVIKPFVGGGFGGKMELRTWEFCAALMAKKNRPPGEVHPRPGRKSFWPAGAATP